MSDIVFTQSFRYTYLKTVYESSNSAFIEAFDEKEKRKVGIKRVYVEKRYLPRAESEAKVIHKLANWTSNIPALYMTHYDELTETYYLIMQLIEGGLTLREQLSTRVPMRTSVDLLIKLCDIMAPLHHQKYQHRDIKPENVLLRGQQVFLIDFNLTAALPRKGEGTANYQAPEQNEYLEGIGLDRVDVFALGLILYELLVGEVPRLGVDYSSSMLSSSLNWEFFNPPMYKDPQIPSILNDIVMKCLKYNPKERYRDARELKYALQQFKRS